MVLYECRILGNRTKCGIECFEAVSVRDNGLGRGTSRVCIAFSSPNRSVRAMLAVRCRVYSIRRMLRAERGTDKGKQWTLHRGSSGQCDGERGMPTC